MPAAAMMTVAAAAAAAAARLTELREDAYTKVLKCFVKQPYDMVRRSAKARRFARLSCIYLRGFA